MKEGDNETLLDILQPMQEAILACGTTIDAYYNESHLGKLNSESCPQDLIVLQVRHLRSQDWREHIAGHIDSFTGLRKRVIDFLALRVLNRAFPALLKEDDDTWEDDGDPASQVGSPSFNDLNLDLHPQELVPGGTQGVNSRGLDDFARATSSFEKMNKDHLDDIQRRAFDGANEQIRRREEKSRAAGPATRPIPGVTMPPSLPDASLTARVSVWDVAFGMAPAYLDDPSWVTHPPSYPVASWALSGVEELGGPHGQLLIEYDRQPVDGDESGGEGLEEGEDGDSGEKEGEDQESQYSESCYQQEGELTV